MTWMWTGWKKGEGTSKRVNRGRQNVEAASWGDSKDKGVKWGKTGKVVYYFSRATVTSYHKLGSLKQQKFILSQF